MSVVGIVALSLLAGLFIALLIGTSAWLIWQGHQFKKIVAETRATLASHRDDWATSLRDLKTILSEHRALTDASISKINGDQLSKAVGTFLQAVQEQRRAAQRIENAAIAVGTFTKQWLSEGVREDTEITEVTTDGYAAADPGERWTGRSRVASDDAAALAEESAEVTGADQ